MQKQDEIQKRRKAEKDYHDYISRKRAKGRSVIARYAKW
jgi:hypothetical protein